MATSTQCWFNVTLGLSAIKLNEKGGEERFFFYDEANSDFQQLSKAWFIVEVGFGHIQLLLLFELN